MAQGDKQSAPEEAIRLSSRVSLVYWLFLGWVILPVLPIFVLAGIVIAYVSKPQATPAEASHYLFQIRTFWIWLLVAFVGISLRIVGIGWLILIALWVWMLVRCVWGLRLVYANRAHPRPTTLSWS